MGASQHDPRPVVEGIEPAYLGLGRVFALARDAVIVGEASTGRIVLWNAAAEAMFGYTPDEAHSILIEELVPDELKDAHRQGIARYATEGRGPLIDTARVVELPARRKDGGAITVELSLTPIESDRIEGRYVMAIVRDVTERKNLEHELERALNELRAANQELTDLAAVAAHELGNPLSVLMGFSSLLAEHWDETSDDDKKRYSAAIHRQVNRMSKLASDLLTMSRLESGAIDAQLCDLPLRAAIGRAVGDLGTAVDIDVTCPEELEVRADPEHVQRIFLNYLSNAIKYGEPPITVAAVASTGGSVEIRVCDAGYGVPEEFVPRLFGRFVRGLRDGAGAPGSGLGLSIVRALARMNGGDAWYEANYPRGSRFCVRLPGPRTAAPTAADVSD